jgi:hypothetical protein
VGTYLIYQNIHYTNRETEFPLWLNGQRGGGEQVPSVPRPWPNHPVYSTGFEVLLFRPSMPRILHIPQLPGPMAILKQNTNCLDYVNFLPFHIFLKPFTTKP